MWLVLKAQPEEQTMYMWPRQGENIWPQECKNKAQGTSGVETELCQEGFFLL